MKYFDSKTFNGEVFLGYMETIPDTRKNQLVNAGVFVGNPDLLSSLSAQVGGNYIVKPMLGLIDGESDNYDGATDITSSTLDTYNQGIVVIGRAKGFREKDFSYDITGKTPFMSHVASQLVKYWANDRQHTLLSILKGIFGVTAFKNTHVHEVAGEIDVTSLNTAAAKGCGDNKDIIKVVVMHSAVATQLENKQLLEYAKYTEKDGIERRTNIAYYNGRLVLVDDACPVEDVQIESKNYKKYTTYCLGIGAFTYQPVGALVPVEMYRDPKTNGGEDTLYSRERYVLQPFGFTFKQSAMATASPTNTELAKPASWELVKNSNGAKTIDTKAIPLVAITSLIAA